MVGEIGAADWAKEVSKTLAGFDATQHNSTNHRHALSGDEATCWSYMTAEHIFIEDGDSSSVTLGGEYKNTLVRDGSGWRIARCQLTIHWSRGDMMLFPKAQQRAAEKGLFWQGE
ncbi:MAG: nuclear transport factor 2 family protein [Pseudomonadota bacterium]